MRKILSSTAVALALACAGAHADPLPTDTLVYGNGGDATATYIGYEAADFDSVSLSMGGSMIFANGACSCGGATAMGTTVDLGTFPAGSEIEFQLTDWSVPATWFTGPGSRNADGNVHADVVTDPTQIPGFGTLPAASQAFAPTLVGPDTVFVGFEDRAGPQGDFDYNDLVFAVTDATPGDAVPEPASMAILGSALLGFELMRRRKTLQA